MLGWLAGASRRQCAGMSGLPGGLSDHCRAVVADHRKVFSVLPLVTRLEHEDVKGIAGILSSSASERQKTR